MESEKEMILENLFTKQKQTQTSKTNLWLPKGTGGREGRIWDWHIHTIVYGMDGQ